MRQFTYLEDKILTAIAETHPYPKDDVKGVYLRCRSFDKTISVLENACTFGITPDMQLDNEQMKNSDDLFETLAKATKP